MRLKARTCCRDESFSELAEHLVRLAYPEAADFMVEVLAKYHFVDALDLPEEEEHLQFVETQRMHLRMSHILQAIQRFHESSCAS